MQYKSFSMQCPSGRRKWFDYPSNRKRDYPRKYPAGYGKYSHQNKEITHLSICSEFSKRNKRE